MASQMATTGHYDNYRDNIFYRFVLGVTSFKNYRVNKLFSIVKSPWFLVNVYYDCAIHPKSMGTKALSFASTGHWPINSTPYHQTMEKIVHRPPPLWIEYTEFSKHFKRSLSWADYWISLKLSLFPFFIFPAFLNAQSGLGFIPL